MTELVSDMSNSAIRIVIAALIILSAALSANYSFFDFTKTSPANFVYLYINFGLFFKLFVTVSDIVSSLNNLYV